MGAVVYEKPPGIRIVRCHALRVVSLEHVVRRGFNVAVSLIANPSSWCRDELTGLSL